jgi:hypothetical protein
MQLRVRFKALLMMVLKIFTLVEISAIPNFSQTKITQRHFYGDRKVRR